jgi:hypothetical protein
MEIEVVEYFSNEVWIISREFESSSSNFGQQVLNSLFDKRSFLVFGDLPGLLHHADEVLVAGGAHGELCVVLLPLVPGDDAVVVAPAAVELVEEVGEDLLFALAALDELGVAGHVVDPSDLSNMNSSRIVFIESLECFFDHCQSSLSEWLLQSTNEFFVSYTSVSINIIISHQSLQFDFLWEQSIKKCIIIHNFP